MSFHPVAAQAAVVYTSQDRFRVERYARMSRTLMCSPRLWASFRTTAYAHAWGPLTTPLQRNPFAYVRIHTGQQGGGAVSCAWRCLKARQLHLMQAPASQNDAPASSSTDGAEGGEWQEETASEEVGEDIGGPGYGWDMGEWYTDEEEPAVEASSTDTVVKLELQRKDALLQSDSVPALVRLAYSMNPGVQAGAVTTLLEMDYDEVITVRMVEDGVVPAMFHVLRDSTDAVQKAAIRVLIRLASNQAGFERVMEANGLQCMIKLLESSSTDVQGEVAWALDYLAQTNPETHKVIADAGAIPLLINLLQYHSSKVKYDSWYMSTTTYDEYWHGSRRLEENEDSVNVLLPAVDALKALAELNTGMKDAVVAAGAKEALLRCLDSPCSGVQERAQAALEAMQEAS